MARLIDSEGRLWGRINLVDAVLAAFALLLVPLAYATYLLFRPPTPTITSVEPAQLTITEERAAQGTPLAGKFKVRGSGLRPVLRARVADKDAVAFIFETPTSADILVGTVPPGTHDLVLFDGVQEVARAVGAITIPETATPGLTRVAVAGSMLDVEATASGELKVGAKYPSATDPRVEILALADPEAATLQINNRTQTPVAGRQQRRALLAVRCETAPLQPRECAIGATVLAGGVTFVVPDMPGSPRFLIDAIVPATPPAPATLRLRLVGLPDVLALVKTGDVDQPHLAIDQRGAVIQTVGERRSGTDSAAALVLGIGPTARDSLATLEVTASAGLDAARDGWRYRGDPIKAGGAFAITTPRYTVRALITAIEAETGAASEQR